MLTLYSFGPGANSLKPMLALYEKGLEFTGRFLDPAKFEHHEDLSLIHISEPTRH